MPDSHDRLDDREKIEQAAATWVLRVQNGIDVEGEEALAQWLVSDPRHETAFAEHQAAWTRFTPLARNVAASTIARPLPSVDRRWTPARMLTHPALLAAAAAVVLVGLFVGLPRDAEQSPAPKFDVSAALPDLLQERILEDGSVIVLNRRAEVAVNYTPGTRRVTLSKGEAHFEVAKDPDRPFVVTANGVDVRAVGTAFNVLLDDTGVEVVVTEGRVQVASAPVSSAHESNPSEQKGLMVEAGQATRVELQLQSPRPQIATLGETEIAQRLAWQPRLLDYDNVPLAEIAAEFNRRNPVHLVIADSQLAALRLSASFRSDNVQGFVRLLEANFGVSADRRVNGEVVLRRMR